MKMKNGVKRERDREKHNGFKSKEERTEQIQADHELFLQAFEKPTQIYRYLRTRNLISPIFLNRNLTFMKKRMSRSNEARRNFKIDTLLERRVKEDNEMCVTNLGSYMTLTFLGYYDEKISKAVTDKAQLELILVKFCHKKRKESSSPVVQQPLGTSEVPVNPSEQNPPSKAPALSIPSKSFSLSGVSSVGRIKTYSLIIKVNCGGADENSQDENQEPSAKRRKGGREDENGDIEGDEGRIVSAELVVYDKHSRCLLTEGEYELVLGDVDKAGNKISPAKKNSSWEIIDTETANMSSSQFSVFSNSPTLKFRLSWCSEPAGAMVERPRPLMPRDNGLDGTYLRREKQKKEKSVKVAKSNEKVTRIVYQFLYNNNSRQQTEAREDLHCPWCSLNCLQLYALLKHLKLSHPRFLFTYVPIPEGARIDVSVSELYDSTYVGNPHDMISQPPGYAFSRNGPVQRTTITNILVCKPARTRGSLSEFLELENDEHSGPYENQRPFVSGHNRLYHYSVTQLPIPSHAILHGDAHDEDHPDPEWLRIKTSKMIDDFTDVNAGEKEFMKMWNNHVQKYTYVGDCQMPQALAMFIDIRGQDIVQKNLFRNFSLHLVNLFEFGVIGPSHVFTAISRLQALVRSLGLQHDLSWGNLLPSLTHQMTSSPQNRKSAKMRKNFAGIFTKST